MATFNGEKYVRQQLESLAAQTLLPCELVVTDDGSIDKTIDIVESFAETCPFPVRVSRNDTRLGFADNFLKAAQMCEGSLIAFCDQDDIWMPRKLEKCVYEFVDPNVGMAVHSAELLIDDKQTGRLDPNISFDRTIPPDSGDVLKVYPGMSIVFRSELLEIADNYSRPTNVSASGNLPRTIAHDGWIRLLAATFCSVRLISEPLVLYRQHENNVFGARAKPKFHRRIYFAIKTTDYRLRRESDRELAEFFERLSRGGSEKTCAIAARRAAIFAARANLWDFRIRIYDENSDFRQRFLAFLKILSVGGYRPSTRNDKLGRSAMLKDLFFGLPRLYVYFASDKNP